MTISDTAKAQVFGEEGGGFLELLVIDHPDLDAPLRFVNNNVNITSNGKLYIAYPFTITLPKDRDRAVPSATLVIDNVTREIGQYIREMVEPPTVTISIIRIDDLDAVEQEFPTFTLRNARYNSLTVTGELRLTDQAREPYPQRHFTPSEYPGLF
jgi:hypothetical protein